MVDTRRRPCVAEQLVASSDFVDAARTYAQDNWTARYLVDVENAFDRALQKG